MLILKACGVGAVMGILIGFGIPEEYTASILIAPENTRRSSSSGISALAEMADIDMSSSSATTERDAIYPSLYPAIVSSTPFLIGLFDVKVHTAKDTTTLTLARYLQERQKVPWWRSVTSAPSRLVSYTLSLLKDKREEENRQTTIIPAKTDPFLLTPQEAGTAGAIASRIRIEVNKGKRVITVLVTMQDPLVAAIVADTASAYLREYITEYRTNKARKILEYNEQLCKEAQAEYYAAQEKYTRYEDVNQNLVMLTSRAELSRLRSEMELALSIYNQMEKQVQAAQAKVEKVTPVYAVIQPVVVPLTPSKPRKALIITVCILLSAAGSVGWILFMKDFIEKIKKRIILPVGK